MKLFYLFKGLLFVPLFIAISISAQHKLSFDVGAIRQMNHHAEGLNVSSFYYFNDRLVGGFEMNRFFPVNKKLHEEDVKISAWDFEINFHYLIPILKHWNLYPLSGISHTSEKEFNIVGQHTQFIHFWSANTGVGLQLQLGHWLPHVEYSFTWGYINQQFLLTGLSYDIELGKHSKRRDH
jgi:hypothetical protein